MPIENNQVVISRERFEELIRSEVIAQQFKDLISTKHAHYGELNHDDIRLLFRLYCGEEEEI